ncbi:hypothetical protein WH47_07569, partial [Habropoda laboriosa]
KELCEFSCEISSHLLYSPDITSSDCYLFHAVQHFLVGKKFDSIDSIRNNIVNHFNEKSKKFYSDGIMVLLK